jgi:hypothetical protein
MKKTLLVLLLLPLLGRGPGGGLLSAQTVTVSNLSVSEGSPSTVTFDVSWTRPADPTAMWMDSAWVFVDYNNAGRMTRLKLLLSSGATLTDTSAPGEGTLKEVPGNDRGAWVAGYARTDGSFSATVQLLTVTADLAGACAYASGYPPVGAWLDDAKLGFTGTPMYKVTLTLPDMTTTTIETGDMFMLPCGYTAASFTDKTGAPGIFNCALFAPVIAPAAFCYGASGQLLAAAASNAALSWYDAPAGGTLLSSENILPLTPLYNSTAAYYAQAIMDNGCVVRTRAVYTVNHCTMGGDCPDYTAGSVGVDTPVAAACSAFYPGQIGAEDYPVACVAFDAGRIGDLPPAPSQGGGD